MSMNLGFIPSLNHHDPEEHDTTADKLTAIGTLCNIREIVNSTSDPYVAVEVFAQDPTFRQMFCNDGDPVENLNQYVDASMEGVLQDFLNNGLEGIIAGAYYSSLGRIRRICEEHSGNAGGAVETHISLYLPPYTEFMSTIKKIDAIYDACVKFQKDPKSKVGPVVESVRLAGAKVSNSGKIESLTSVDWKAVLGAIAGQFLAGPIGRVFGAHIASDNGGRITNRGWDAGRLGQACSMIVERIDKVYAIKGTGVAANPDDPELGTKVHFVTSAFKVYLDVLKNVGRGVASACTLIR